MKTAAQVFIWFGIIFGFYMIFPLIVGIIALKKISQCSSKTELQNYGIITLFFCSFLGGLFMMLINDEHSTNHNKNATVITYQKVVSDEELQHINTGTMAKITRNSIMVIVALSLACLFVSIFIVVFQPYYVSYSHYRDYYFRANYISAYMNAIPIWCNVLFLSIPLIIFMYYKRNMNKSCEIVFIIYLMYAVVLFTLTLISAILAAGENRTFALWLTAVLSYIILILTLSIVIRNRLVFKAYKKLKVEKTELENELERIKNLLDNSVVSQAEYEQLRQAVISKYY